MLDYLRAVLGNMKAFLRCVVSLWVELCTNVRVVPTPCLAFPSPPLQMGRTLMSQEVIGCRRFNKENVTFPGIFRTTSLPPLTGTYFSRQLTTLPGAGVHETFMLCSVSSKTANCLEAGEAENKECIYAGGVEQCHQSPAKKLTSALKKW